MDKSKYKKLSLDAVKIITNLFLLEFGKANTLAVKTFLRTGNFWATQKEVSDLMAYYFHASKVTLEIDGKKYSLECKDVITNGFAHKEYYLSNTDGPVKVEPVVEAKPEPVKPVKVDPLNYVSGETIQAYVRRNIHIASNDLSTCLARAGVVASPRKIAAIKANINR